MQHVMAIQVENYICNHVKQMLSLKSSGHAPAEWKKKDWWQGCEVKKDVKRRRSKAAVWSRSVPSRKNAPSELDDTYRQNNLYVWIKTVKWILSDANIVWESMCVHMWFVINRGATRNLHVVGTWIWVSKVCFHTSQVLSKLVSQTVVKANPRAVSRLIMWLTNSVCW